MDGLTRSYLALSGLAAASAYLTDERPAWLWTEDGRSIVWANAAGAAFFGARSLRDLSQLSGLSRSPARPHIARIAASGSTERDSIERLRFYRGLRVMILTCFCRRMTLPGGGNAALIVAAEATDIQQNSKADPALGLCRLLAGERDTTFLVDRSGHTTGACGDLEPPHPEAVLSLIASGKRSPVFGTITCGDNNHEAALVALDDGSAILVVCSQIDTAKPAADRNNNPDKVTGIVSVEAAEAAVDKPDSTVTPAEASDEAGGEEGGESAGPTDTAAQTFASDNEYEDLDHPADDAPSATDQGSEDGGDTAWKTEYFADETNSGAEVEVSPETNNGDEPDIVETTSPSKADDESGPLTGLAHAYTSDEDTPDDGFAFSRHGRPVRFAWKMDIDRRFTFISPEFETVLGPQAADVVGRTWEEVAEQFGIDRDKDIARALARRDTWSGRTVFWPVSGEALRVPVDMAALPAFDRRRVFEGFRGFGVCRGADAIDDPEGRGLNLGWNKLPEENQFSEESADNAGEAFTAASSAFDMSGLSAVEADPLPVEKPEGPEQSGEEARPAAFDPREFPFDDEAREEPESEDSAATENVSDAEAWPPMPAADGEDLTGEDETQTSDVSEGAASRQSTHGEAGENDDEGDEGLKAQALRAERAARAIYKEEASRLTKPEREAFAKIAETLGAASESAEEGILGARDEGHEETDDTEDDNGKSPEGSGREFSGIELAEQPDEGGTPEPWPDRRDETENLESQAGKDLEGGAELTAYQEAETAAENGVNAFAEPGAIDRKLLDRLPIGVAIIREPDVLYVNRALLELLGHRDLGALNRAGGLEALFAEPEDWPATDSEEKTFERTMRVKLADGGTKPVKARLHAVPWGEGHALMMSLLDRHDPLQEAAFDQLHMVQTALGEAEQQVAELDTVLETATDGVLVLDDQATILKVNRSAEALFDAAREQMVGTSLMEYLAPESHRDARDYIEGLAKNGVASVLNDGREVIGRVRGGGLIPLFMTLGRIGTDPSSPRFCAVLRDITQWKTAEEELTDAKRQAENASSQKSDFLAKISHEIRTPLNAIIGFSEVMMEERFGPIGNDRYKEYLRDIHTSGSHLMSLINDLLDLSKIEAGKLDLSFESVSANDIIRECVALMQPQANRERVIIRASLPGSVPNIVADGRSVRQVILNLLSNAIKFNQPGGQVIVSSALEDTGEVVLRVRDTGIGMSPKDLQMALEPFRQLHTARHGGGTGLGLPLTKALVEANRAAFRIDSEPSHGTLVEITFPPQRVLAE
ncbi:PAS domain S-box protein [Rhizobiales bacterium]|uniref:ATP-binding protein n=1 Tax=Hongsoonwoonella zoysiae TaxID=2821844 RepID=UPI001561A7EC|nr:ATP-binding protein [Hongsoonwoonella zoysiae]NRG19918.1 PAS domain S-box protein [Hongsoonwoonella zoysiae]